jgi:hypothetical protein
MGADTKREPRATVNPLDGLGVALRDAILITLIASGVGAGINLVHPERIPFVAQQQYETLVPCPEPGGEVTAMTPNDPLLTASETFLVDARAEGEHAFWSFGDAMNVPYDYLDPTPDEVVQDLAERIARSKAQRVVVYGDGATPDTGEQLGREISGKGIKNVVFVAGGAPALKKSKRPEG